ncbi:MAG: N-acetyltransferase [Oscillospiraceae bacterium]|nr:N-acetyltransferase [Oscillospiraceae bacterium]
MSIRMANPEDLPQILAIYAPYVTNTTYSFEYEPPTAEEFTQRFLGITKQFPWLVWEEDGQVLGYAYASAPFTRAAYSWCVEPSIYLAPEAQGKGIGRRLYEALEDILQKQGYQVCYAIITEENRASVAFHEAIGYRFLAEFPRCGFKHGRWIGVIWMEKRLNLVDIPSKKPAFWGTIVKNDRNF